jgi:hypothetical protein
LVYNPPSEPRTETITANFCYCVSPETHCLGDKYANSCGVADKCTGTNTCASTPTCDPGNPPICPDEKALNVCKGTKFQDGKCNNFICEGKKDCSGWTEVKSDN